MKLLVGALLAFILISSNCKKNEIHYNIPCNSPTNDIKISKDLILGKWTWSFEKYLDRISQTYIIKTPQTEGYTQQYEFLKTSDVKIYQNQSLVKTVTFEITTLNVVTGSDMDKGKTILLFKNKLTGQRTDFSPMMICNDTLSLNYQAYSDTKGQEKWSKN